MPVYEYECSDCGQVTEVIRSMSQADAPLACGSCGASKTKRKHSIFAAHSGHGGALDTSADVPPCQRCGGPPGSCAM